jgi:hypothetical protein
VLRIRIRYPRSGAFLPPRIRIRNEFFPDLWSRIQGVPVCFWWDFLKNPCFLTFLLIKLAPETKKKQEKSWFYFSSLFLCSVGSVSRHLDFPFSYRIWKRSRNCVTVLLVDTISYTIILYYYSYTIIQNFVLHLGQGSQLHCSACGGDSWLQDRSGAGRSL